MLDETLQPSDESYDVSDVEAFAAAHQSPSDTMGDGDGTAAAPTLSKPGLLVMDVDSTLIDEEVIDELGEAAGSGDEIAKVTERAMRGEIEFCDALRERVALLKGLPVSVFDTVHDKLHFTNGALALIDELHRQVGRSASCPGDSMRSLTVSPPKGISTIGWRTVWKWWMAR